VQILAGAFAPSRISGAGKDADIQAGIRYLRRCAAHPRRLTTEVVAVPRSDGVGTIVHNNNMCDTLCALSLVGDNPSSGYLARALVKQLPANGYWVVEAQPGSRELSTWPTAEWILAVTSATHHQMLRLRHATVMVAVTSALATALVTLVLLTDSASRVGEAWTSLPDSLRSVLLGGLVVGALGSMLGTFIYERVRRNSAARAADQGVRANDGS
jgi:hypothetical protein